MENENKRNNFQARRVKFENSGGRKILRRIILLIVLVAITLALRFFSDYKFILIPDSLLDGITIFIYVFASLLIATLLIRFTENSVFRFFAVDKEEWEQKVLVTKAYAAFVYALALLVPLVKMGLSLANITIFLGLFATGLALAVRDIIVSYISWYIILNKKPFRIGDYISFDNHSGVVRRIGVFFITLEQMDVLEVVKVPTNLLLTKLIHNHGQGRVSIVLKFPMFNIPPDFETRVMKTKSLIMGITGEKNPDKIRMEPDSDGERIFLEIFFYLPWASIRQKGMISAKVYELNHDFLFVSKGIITQEH